MSYEKKLMEMKKLLGKPAKAKVTKKEQSLTKPPSPSYEEKWLAAGLEKETNQFGVVYKKVIHYPGNYRHGSVSLEKLSAVYEKWQKHEGEHPLAPHCSHPIIFLDTETTGLKGAGTLVFLLGILQQTASGFVMTQYVLPNPDHEAAFLYASKLWKQEHCIITYNGKSFDLPQVGIRWTMNRQLLPPLREHFQIDLLHSSRRIWQDEVSRFRLVNMEEEQLGFHRKGDIPGHLAPIIYQDAVKSGEIATLLQVLRHNEWDILSLVALYIASSELLFMDDISSPTIETNIGKWYVYLKQYEKSEQFFEKVIREYGENHPITHFHFGFILKKHKAYDEAYQSFSIVSKQLLGKNQIIALEEMAKLLEHRFKQFPEALEMTEKAQRLLSSDGTLTKKFREREIERFAKREIRLRKKIFPG